VYRIREGKTQNRGKERKKKKYVKTLKGKEKR
jgi:hypothetical protein